MLDKAFIKSTVVFSFTTLCTTNLDRINRITPNTYLSIRFQSSSFIVSDFVPERGLMQFLLIEIIFNLHPLIPEVCSIKLLNSWSLAFFSGHHFHSNLALIPLFGSQIILSTILAIQNNNHTQKNKYLCGKPFFFEGKNHGTNSE